MAEHYTSVTINAPVHQVYELFTHFSDFPTFMHFVREVTPIDEQRSHWVVHVLRNQSWDAINEDCIPNQQIGWRSTTNVDTRGKVKFRSHEPNRTIVDVYLHYTPPFGPLGRLVDMLGVGSHIEAILKEDLAHFARMVEQIPSESLDPMASHYLFHSRSATTCKKVTPRYEQAMRQDPRMRAEALTERRARIEREQAEQRTAQQARATAAQEKHEREQHDMDQQQAILAREALKRTQEQKEQAEEQARLAQNPHVLHPVYDTLGGRNASRDRTAFGDRDGNRPRHPAYERSQMSARYPLKGATTRPLSTDDETDSSPWFHSIRGTLVLSLPPLPKDAQPPAEQDSETP